MWLLLLLFLLVTRLQVWIKQVHLLFGPFLPAGLLIVFLGNFWIRLFPSLIVSEQLEFLRFHMTTSITLLRLFIYDNQWFLAWLNR